MIKKIAIPSLLLVVAFGIFFMIPDRKNNSNQKDLTSSAPVESLSGPTNKTAVKEIAVLKNQNSQKENTLAADYEQLAAAVTQFSNYKQKPLLTNDEKIDYQKLFSKSNIDDAAKILTHKEPTVSQQTELVHQAAVGFLLEALSENPTAAREAIVAVANYNFANVETPLQARELLAKDKAELLFHALAKDPSLKSSLSRVDVITQKIINNIKQEHDRNLALSTEEVAKFKSGKW